MQILLNKLSTKLDVTLYYRKMKISFQIKKRSKTYPLSDLDGVFDFSGTLLLEEFFDNRSDSRADVLLLTD
jgi:hypothetical protein